MSSLYRYHLCDVFTERPFSGKPLAVFPNAVGLSNGLMRNIATELGVAKTTFVFPPETRVGTHRLRSFSPAGELPVAYHESIGTALTKAWNGEVPPFEGNEIKFVFEYGATPFEVRVLLDRRCHAVVQVPAGLLPSAGSLPPPTIRVAETLSLDCFDLEDVAFAPRIIHCGLPCLFVPVRSLDAARRVRLNEPCWDDLSEEYGASCICVFTLETEDADSDVHSRFYAPALGIADEPASGRAAVGLASILAGGDARCFSSAIWRIEQGLEFGRPSKIGLEVETRFGIVSRIHIGGAAFYIGQGAIDVPVHDECLVQQFGTDLGAAGIGEHPVARVP